MRTTYMDEHRPFFFKVSDIEDRQSYQHFCVWADPPRRSPNKQMQKKDLQTLNLLS